MVEYIVFEGADGSGKSSTLRTVKASLEEKGHKVFALCEPMHGGLNDHIRKEIFSLDFRESKHTLQKVITLFALSRMYAMDHIRTIEASHPNESVIVLSDRNAITSYVYQLLIGCDGYSDIDREDIIALFIGLHKDVIAPDQLYVLDTVVDLESETERTDANSYDRYTIDNGTSEYYRDMFADFEDNSLTKLNALGPVFNMGIVGVGTYIKFIAPETIESRTELVVESILSNLKTN